VWVVWVLYVSRRVHVGGRGGVVTTATIPRFRGCFLVQRLFRVPLAVVVGGPWPRRGVTVGRRWVCVRVGVGGGGPVVVVMIILLACSKT
jgi:hypothetical protein